MNIALKHMRAKDDRVRTLNELLGLRDELRAKEAELRPLRARYEALSNYFTDIGKLVDYVVDRGLVPVAKPEAAKMVGRKNMVTHSKVTEKSIKKAKQKRAAQLRADRAEPLQDSILKAFNAKPYWFIDDLAEQLQATVKQISGGIGQHIFRGTLVKEKWLLAGEHYLRHRYFLSPAGTEALAALLKGMPLNKDNGEMLECQQAVLEYLKKHESLQLGVGAISEALDVRYSYDQVLGALTFLSENDRIEQVGGLYSANKVFSDMYERGMKLFNLLQKSTLPDWSYSELRLSMGLTVDDMSAVLHKLIDEGLVKETTNGTVYLAARAGERIVQSEADDAQPSE